MVNNTTLQYLAGLEACASCYHPHCRHPDPCHAVHLRLTAPCFSVVLGCIRAVYGYTVQEYDGLAQGRVAAGSQGGSAHVVDYPSWSPRDTALPTDGPVPGDS